MGIVNFVEDNVEYDSFEDFVMVLLKFNFNCKLELFCYSLICSVWKMSDGKWIWKVDCR